uniref:hypothetical protein n=1 Tax=Rhizobium rhizogenes TaxID=359 RepID=UPI001910E161|nr:hypothetical protein [Rhizobium rhizogenes]
MPSCWTTGTSFKLRRLLGKLSFKFYWRSIAKGGVLSLGILNLFDEPGQSLGDVRKRLVAGGADVFHFSGSS